jgi:hypothetical protein
MSDPLPSNNDPMPEARQGDSSFAPVVVAFAIAILVILVAAVIFVKVRQTRAIPKPHDAHPTSQMIRPAIQTETDTA